MTGGGGCSSSHRCVDKQKCFRSEACKTVHREETKKCHPKKERKKKRRRQKDQQAAGSGGWASGRCPAWLPSGETKHENSAGELDPAWRHRLVEGGSSCDPHLFVKVFNYHSAS